MQQREASGQGTTSRATRAHVPQHARHATGREENHTTRCMLASLALAAVGPTLQNVDGATPKTRAVLRLVPELSQASDKHKATTVAQLRDPESRSKEGKKAKEWRK